MGSVLSNAASSAGTVIGNALLAPLEIAFGGSCEDICLGTWDITCFINNICIIKLLKLMMVCILCYIVLCFFYLFYKVGVFQCIAKSLCKMGCGACKMYWCALHDITCFLWHKLRNTKRVYRGGRDERLRLRDIEQGYISSSDEEECESLDNDYRDRKRKPSVRDRRKHHHLHSSLHTLRRESPNYVSHDHHVRPLKTRDVPVHVKGESSSLGPSKYSRHHHQLSIGKANNLQRGATVFKKRGHRKF